MADIELVIRMPEELKEALDNIKKENAFSYMWVYGDTIYNAIKNSTPLPKGHGRLIDADALWKKWVFDAIGKQEIDEAPTIIEADKAEMEVTQTPNEFADNIEESGNK